jgi:hypothetical protein
VTAPLPPPDDHGPSLPSIPPTPPLAILPCPSPRRGSSPRGAVRCRLSPCAGALRRTREGGRPAGGWFWGAPGGALPRGWRKNALWNPSPLSVMVPQSVRKLTLSRPFGSQAVLD